MKLAEIQFEVFAGMQVSIEQIGLIMSIAKMHYDGVCKDAAEEGGFLYGMRNWEKMCPGSVHTLSNRQVQTLIKIMEIADVAAGTELAGDVINIRKSLWGALRRMGNETPDKIVVDQGVDEKQSVAQ